MRHYFFTYMVSALCVFFAAGQVHAEDSIEELVADEAVGLAADRPAFGDATTTVPPFRLALESGVTLTTADDGAGLELPNLLLRYGLTDWFELRVQVPGLSLPIDTDGQGPAGTDGGVGFKFAVAVHQRVGLSWVSTFGVPVADLVADEQAFHWASTLNLGISLNDTFSLNATAAAGLRQPLEVEDASMSWNVGGSFGVSGTFVDTGLYVDGIAVTDHDGALRLALGLGLTQMLTDTLQLDLTFDYDLPDYGSSIRIGAGVATLF